MRKTRNETLSEYLGELEQVANLWNLEAFNEFIKKWGSVLGDDLLSRWEKAIPIEKEMTIIKINKETHPDEKTKAKMEEYKKLLEEQIKTQEDYDNCDGLLKYLKGDNDA